MRPPYLIAVLWALSLASADRAAAAPKESPAYTQAVTLGLTEFEEKNFAVAWAQFLRAHALSPSARTLRGLGMVEFELKHQRLRPRIGLARGLGLDRATPNQSSSLRRGTSAGVAGHVRVDDHGGIHFAHGSVACAGCLRREKAAKARRYRRAQQRFVNSSG